MQRVRRAKPDGAVRSSAAPQVHRPSYAQVPRRAGELDAEDRGYLHHALAGGEGKSARRVSAARAEERTKRLTAPSPPSWPSRSAARSSR